jgi:hypothetical protein
MPTYTFRDEKTKKKWTEMMTIAEMESILNRNAHIKLVPAAPFIGDPMRQGIKKPTEGFRDILREMKRKNRSAWTPPKINTF